MRHPSNGATIRPAERDRGCIFKDDFRSQANMVASGWTLFNAPTFDARGMELDGTNQYGTLPLQQELNSADLTIHIEFYPDFATDEDVVRYIYSSKDVARDYSLFKLKNDNANILFVTMGGVNITSMPEATYSPYWIVGGRNVITISSTSTDTNIWLNTGAILVGAAQAWSPKQQTMLYAGSSITGGNKFDGSISRLYIGHHTSDLAEHTAVYNNTMWSYQNRAVVDLQFRTADYDIGNVRTLDSSGNGNHATLGDGSTPTTYPTQGAGRMTFDGTSDYLDLGSMAQPAGAFTVACVPLITAPLGTTRCIADHTNSARTDLAWSLVRYSTNDEFIFYVGSTADRILSSAYPDRLAHTIVATWDGTTAEIYVDGKSDKTSTVGTPAQPSGAVQPMRIGARTDGAQKIQGSVFDFIYSDGEAWNATQAADYHSNVMRRMGAEQ